MLSPGKDMYSILITEAEMKLIERFSGFFETSFRLTSQSDDSDTWSALLIALVSVVTRAK